MNNDGPTDEARSQPRRRQPTVPVFYPDWLILRELAAHVKRSLSEVGTGRLLDLGCGEKPFLVYRPPNVTDWVGLDVPENPHADVHGYADALPFEHDSFNTVLCTELLEHVTKPERVVREIARVLKPGGYVVLTVPLYFPIHEEPYDFFRYTPYGLRFLFEGAGLEVIRLEPLATGLRLVGIAINTCFNDFGKTLPYGRTWIGRAVFAPVYLTTNIFAHILAPLIPDTKNAVGTALLARKMPGSP